MENKSAPVFISLPQLWLRTMLLFSTVFYCVAIGISLKFYLSIEHWSWGFSEPFIAFNSVLFCIFWAVLISLFLPIRIKKPSSLILVTLAYIVVLPTLVITVFNYDNGVTNYWYPLSLLNFGFLFACFISSRVRSNSVGNELPDSSVVTCFVLVACFMALILVYEYASIMRFATLAETYDQRQLGQASSSLIGYVQIYFAYFVSPALLAMGLSKRNLLLFFSGLAGFILVYSITAERTVLLLPVAMLIIHNASSIKDGIGYITLVFLSAIFISLVSLLFGSSALINGLALYFVYRVIAIPGLLFSQYFDFFKDHGYTYWTHVRGIELFVDVPQIFKSDPLFPYLGRILAQRLLEIESNSNANLFAYDGAAALGGLGVLIVCLILLLWLVVLDFVTKRWSIRFVLPLVFPMAYALTNGSLFTILLSFGGLFWIVLFVFMPSSSIKSQNRSLIFDQK